MEFAEVLAWSRGCAYRIHVRVHNLGNQAVYNLPVVVTGRQDRWHRAAPRRIPAWPIRPPSRPAAARRKWWWSWDRPLRRRVCGCGGQSAGLAGRVGRGQLSTTTLCGLVSGARRTVGGGPGGPGSLPRMRTARRGRRIAAGPLGRGWSPITILRSSPADIEMVRSGSCPRQGARA